MGFLKYCMRVGCNQTVNCGGARGLCVIHLREMQYTVKRGRTTYAAEVAAGRCLPVVAKSVHSKRMWVERTAGTTSKRKGKS